MNRLHYTQKNELRLKTDENIFLLGFARQFEGYCGVGMDKATILAEIRRTASANGNAPLGRLAFFSATGIKESDWRGRYWARWNDAVREAGFTPNQKQEAYSSDDLIQRLVVLIREIGKFPTSSEIRLRASKDGNFPADKTFARFGNKRGLISAVVAYCQARTDFEDVLQLCETETLPPIDRDDTPNDERFGFVYLLRSGRHYKIGKTNAAGRRERELAIQLPEKANTVHVIRTDDPSGIEAYWHRRFEARHTNGEWFALTVDDVKAFKRRKFM